MKLLLLYWIRHCYAWTYMASSATECYITANASKQVFPCKSKKKVINDTEGNTSEFWKDRAVWRRGSLSE